MYSFFRALPRGNSLLRMILIVAAVFLFGNMILGMVIKIAFGALALAINVALFLLIVGALFYFIRAMSGKAEPK
jgi:hypothetical protein